jgi:tripartite-type tricarboxylate transporter receptor subunit TctC
LLAPVLAVVLVLAPPPPASAQAFPAKPIRMVVPYVPGGLPDTLGRIVGTTDTEDILGEIFSRFCIGK